MREAELEPHATPNREVLVERRVMLCTLAIYRTGRFGKRRSTRQWLDRQEKSSGWLGSTRPEGDGKELSPIRGGHSPGM